MYLDYEDFSYDDYIESIDEYFLSLANEIVKEYIALKEKYWKDFMAAEDKTIYRRILESMRIDKTRKLKQLYIEQKKVEASLYEFYATDEASL